jgi:hypothetical protein
VQQNTGSTEDDNCTNLGSPFVFRKDHTDHQQGDTKLPRRIRVKITPVISADRFAVAGRIGDPPRDRKKIGLFRSGG